MDHQEMKQAVLDYLPGYMFDGQRVVSTGIALAPTQFISPKNGEVMYYVRPLFQDCSPIGMYIRHNGVVESLRRQEAGNQPPPVGR